MRVGRLPGQLAAWLALLGMILAGFTPVTVAAATVYKAPSRQALTIADVQKVIAQAVGEARARTPWAAARTPINPTTTPGTRNMGWRPGPGIWGCRKAMAYI